MDRVYMCWIQNESVDDDKKGNQAEKSIVPQDKTEEKDEKDALDAIDLEVVGSKGIRIHAELRRIAQVKKRRTKSWMNMIKRKTGLRTLFLISVSK
jgi:hypothetical protein